MLFLAKIKVCWAMGTLFPNSNDSNMFVFNSYTSISKHEAMNTWS